MLSTACYHAAMAKPATSPRSGLRKLPTQARSRARVEVILKAAGALLGEIGYDGVTTNLIAERAGVPVGSIYQFFETKDDGIAGIQAEANAFVCVFSGSQSHARFDALARELRATLVGHLDRVFAEAFPKLAKTERSRMLAAWSDITGAMIASLDRSKPGERGKLLDELKTILSAYLDAKLAVSG